MRHQLLESCRGKTKNLRRFSFDAERFDHAFISSRRRSSASERR